MLVCSMDSIKKSDVQISGSHEKRDADIEQAVPEALERDILVPLGRIRATVSDRVVTLEGTVDYLSQYHDAAHCVRQLAGVHRVNNLLAVHPSLPRLAPLTVRSAVQQALARHAEQASMRVQIALAAGKVTLSGEVPSWSDRNAVEKAVRATPGVLKVENQLNIQA
jgi:osmotically-inducible protein OsmY